MIIWIDAQLSPAVARWIAEHFNVQTVAVRDLGLREASDRDIFTGARRAGAVVMTKDSDFVKLLDIYGAPPQVILLTCGNTSNTHLKQILGQTLKQALLLLQSGEYLVEVDDISSEAE